MPAEMIFAVLTLLGAVALGAIAPGPSFLFVARTAVAESRRAGLAVACGMGVGATFFAILVMAGLQSVIARFATLYAVAKGIGSLYIIYMGFCLWRDSTRPLVAEGTAGSATLSARTSFLRGLLTQVSNPKAMLIYGSMFASLLPRELPLAVSLVIPLLVFVVETAWYSIVALSLSSPSPRAAYLRGRKVIDRLCGGLLALLGLRLLLAQTLRRAF